MTILSEAAASGEDDGDASGGLSDALTGRYANDAPIYRERGWVSVLPLPPGQKLPPPSGYTGYRAAIPTAAQIDTWRREHPDGNTALRLPGGQGDAVGLLGIDIDNYAKGSRPAGRAAEVLTEIEQRVGCALPPTYYVAHRDDGSRKLIYRIPVGLPLPWRSNLGPGVDLIHAGHRYLNVGINPATGNRERWYAPNGERISLPPRPADCAALPPQFVREFSSSRNGSTAAEPVNDAELDEFLNAAEHNRNEQPRKLRGLLKQFDTAMGNGASRHDTLRDMLCEGFREARAGFIPAREVYDELRRRFEQRKPEAPQSEFDNAARWAAAQALATDPDETAARAAGAGSVETYRIAKHAIQNGIPMKQLGDRDSGETPASAPAGDVGPTWAPVDMRTARRDQQASVPTLGRRIDGECLFYPGKVHWLHGETESGKSWLAQYAAAQCLSGSETDAVLYVDFEDNAADVAARLIALGVPGDVVDDPARFAYVRPEFAPDIERERNAFDALLTRRFAFAVIDGVTESMAMARLSDNDTADVATWQLQQPRAIASRTGAAVVCIDHVTKDADTRGRHAIGSQHKLAGLDGAAFVMGMSEPFGVGLAGVATVRVGKDRPGQVRRFGVDYSPKEQTHVVAKFRLDATAPDSIAAALMAPAAGETQAPRGKAAKASHRPTWEMEQVSKYWDDTADAGERTHNKTVDAMYRRCAGTDRTPSRQAWRDAVGLLADEGYATSDEGPRGAQVYRNAKPYREADDPKSERRHVVIPMRRETDDGPKS